MARMRVAVISLTLLAVLALASCVPAWPGAAAPWQQGGGMMGGQGGMMGGQGGMMGGGSYNPRANNPQVTPITVDQAAEAVRRYLDTYGKGLTVAEVMEFTQNFYAEVEEEATGVHAMELLVDKYTGQVSPEMGPNMMWNAKYSPMSRMMGNYGGAPAASMPVSADRARSLAQQYLDNNLPGLTVAEADPFYGYYTLHTLKNGQVEGMLSVNGYTGAVWYHSWHGPFIGMKGFDDGR